MLLNKRVFIVFRFKRNTIEVYEKLARDPCLTMDGNNIQDINTHSTVVVITMY